MASATFDVEYIGFPTDARIAFQTAVDIWSQHLDSDIPIRVVARWESASAPDVLGATNPRVIANFARAPEREVWFTLALANALEGRDLDPDEPHIRTSFNSEFDRWYFGTDGQTPAGQFDLVTIALHELGHGLGFVGSMVVAAGEGSWGLGTQGFPIIFDRFAERGAISLLDEDIFPNPSPALAAALTSEDVFFGGASAVRAQGGERPALHAPPEWVSGSSYSHLSEQRVGGVEPYPPGSVNSLMTPTIGSAEAVHQPGPVVCGMFADMGWPLAAACATDVPEPPAVPPDDRLALDLTSFQNPIRGEGVASFSLRSQVTQPVDIQVFDVRGRRVDTLFRGTLFEGEERDFGVRGGRLASGVYFVWIEAPDFSETVPVTIIR